MEAGIRNSCYAPEVIPVDSTPQPYTEYSGPQTFIDKSQKEVAWGDAQLEKCVEEGKEGYNVEGLEPDDGARGTCPPERKQRRSADEWYENFRELAKKNVGWVLLVLTIIVLTVVIKVASEANHIATSSSQGGGVRYNGTDTTTVGVVPSRLKRKT